MKLLLTAMRITVLVTLLLGIAIWAGYGAPLRRVHMSLGALLGILLLALGVAVTRSTGRVAASMAAVAWTVLLITYGVTQARILPGDVHWLAQLVHVLIGLATLGVAQRIVRVAPSVGAMRAGTSELERS